MFSRASDVALCTFVIDLFVFIDQTFYFLL